MPLLRDINPSNRMPLADWIERHIVLPQKAGTPGPVRLYPYQRAICEALEDPDTSELVIQCFSQMGKTFLTGAYTWWCLAYGQSSIFAMPSEKLMRMHVKNEFWPTIQASPHVMNQIVLTPRGNLPEWGIQGRHSNVLFRTPTAAAGFKNASSPLVLADEIDEYPALPDSPNPLSPLRSRGQSFPGFKLVLTSTPGKEGNSLIASELENTTYEKWFMPCLNDPAAEWQTWGFDDVREVRNQWRLYCPTCGEEIVEGERQKAVAAGEFRITNHEAPRHRRGIYLNQLVSPTSSVARTWEAYNAESPSGFWTQVMALPYSVKAIEPINPESLDALYREPEGERICRSVGIDPGGRMLSVQCVDYYVNPDNPAQPRQHIELHYNIYLPREIPIDAAWVDAYTQLNNDLRTMKPDVVVIDIGNMPEYSGTEFALRHLKQQPFMNRLQRDGRLLCVKGIGQPDAYDARPLIHGDIRYESGKAINRTVAVNSDIAKNTLYPLLQDAIEQAAAGERPCITIGPDRHSFADEFDGELAGSYQLLRVVSRNGVETSRWQRARKHRERREGWDCWQYAYCGYVYLGDRVRHKGRPKLDAKRLAATGFL